MNARSHARVIRDSSEAGFTLVEVVIASVLLLMLSYLIAALTIRGMDAQKYAERMTRVTEIAQDVVDEMRRGLTSSVRVFTDDATGSGYDAIINYGPLPAPIDSETLPRLDGTGFLEPDTGPGGKTGNVLFFARYAWTDEFEVTSGQVYRVDVHRLEKFYLTPDGPGPRDGVPDGLNLVRWVSEPIADGSQVDSITDIVDRAEVLVHLLSQTSDVHGNTHDAVELVWLLGEDPATVGTLRQIDVTGDLLTSPASPRTDPWEILPQIELCKPGVLYYRHHSVATNFARTVMGVGRFGFEDSSGDGFPHGLEIQVVGPASARQVLAHLTLVSTNNAGHRAFHDMQIISDVRDL